MIWYQDGFGSALDGVPDTVNHLFGLLLNPMRGKTEETRLVAVSDYRHEIETLLNNEKVEPYSEPGESEFGGSTTWHKVFHKDGPLEWFNAPDSGHGVIELRRNGWRRVA